MNLFIFKIKTIAGAFALTILFSSLSFSVAKGQGVNMKNVPITWHDFKKKRNKKNQFVGAHISMEHDWHYKVEQIGDHAILRLEVSVKLDKKKSWVKKGFLKNRNLIEKQSLLNHEKGHWLLAMIYFKKLQKTLKSHYQFPYNGYESIINGIIRKNFNQLKKQQILYDRATNHHRNIQAQHRWEQKLLNQYRRLYGGKIQKPQTFRRHYKIIGEKD